jgi:excinuclease ABC subunit C
MHQIKRCKAPCVGLVSSRRLCGRCASGEMFLRGRHSEVIDGLTRGMEKAAVRVALRGGGRLARPGSRPAGRAASAVRQFDARRRRGSSLPWSERGGLCVNLAMVRGGLHLGDRAYFPQAAGEVEAGEGLPHSWPSTMPSNSAPTRLILGIWPLEDLPEGLNAGNAEERDGTRLDGDGAEQRRLALQARWQAKARSSGRLAACRRRSTCRSRRAASNASTSAIPWARAPSPPAWSASTAR